MSLWSIRPDKTETYAHYLWGLGIGVVIGGFAGWDFHLGPVLFGALIMVIALRIDHSVTKKARTERQTPEELIVQTKKEIS